jgi:hypothetical protein
VAEYREVGPGAPLVPHLACLWTQRVAPDEPAHTVRVVPDACVDVVWFAGAEPLIAGPDTGPAPELLRPGTLVAGARFRPGAAAGFLGVASSELRDRRLPLAAAWGGAASRRLADDPGRDPGAMLERLRVLLEARLPSLRPPDPVLPPVLRWASLPRPRRGLHGLTAAVGISERQLRRVLRFRRMVRLAGGGVPLADLAAEAGYADQAHMGRECLRLSGLTPAALMAEWFKTGEARPG